MHMVTDSHAEIVFSRLPQVDAADLIALMNDPRVRRHLPLARGVFGPAECEQFVEMKERIWAEHGYGPWAFVIRGEFAGWGGLQPEGEDIDLGLVLRPSSGDGGRPCMRGSLRLHSRSFTPPRSPSCCQPAESTSAACCGSDFALTVRSTSQGSASSGTARQRRSSGPPHLTGRVNSNEKSPRVY